VNKYKWVVFINGSRGHRSGHVLDVLIDVDLGMGRTRISNIESALQLVNLGGNAEGISYRGIQAYSGRVQHIKEFAERDHVYTGQLRFLSALIAALDKRGLKPATVSGGGTGTLALDCREGILTEHQAGSYIFMDVEYDAVTCARTMPTPRSPRRCSSTVR
jgi:D-serine deaminase-like pyridoxal phosphate-dependent protein